MAKASKKLTDRQVRSLTEGRHSDGDGLYLVVGKTARRWVFMYRPKRPRGTGAGPLRETPIGRFGDQADEFTLQKARDKAAELRLMLANGGDPAEAKPVTRTIPTFGQMADELIAKRREEYRSDKSLARIKRALEHHAAPLRPLAVDKITEDDVMDVLRPLWADAPIMGEKVRGYIWTVMENASTHYAGRNPATWTGRLEGRLPKRKRLKKGNHAAMPYEEMADFMGRLRARQGVAARALEFLILTAVRSAEVRLARWSEIDLDAALWTIPKDRTKYAREHRVPLSDRALAILRELATADHGPDGLVFSSAKKGAPLSVMTFSKALTLMGVAKTKAVPHGFRSTFRDWAEEEGGFSFELSEQAVAHVVGDGTVRAYRRRDGLKQRRQMMQAWADYCARPAAKAKAA
jgi:integrase